MPRSLWSCSPRCRQAGGAPLEEIAASFARLFGSVDLEKLDIVVGFALVEILQAGLLGLLLPQLLGFDLGCLQNQHEQRACPPCRRAAAASVCAAPASLPLQVQQRKAAIADRLRQRSIPIERGGAPMGAAQQEAAGSGASSSRLGSHAGQRLDRGDSAFGSLSPGVDASSGSSGSSSEAASAAGGAAGQGEVRIDMEPGFRRWMKEVSGEHSFLCTNWPSVWREPGPAPHLLSSPQAPLHAEGSRMCVTPSRWGAELAPQLTAQESAAIYTGGGSGRRCGGGVPPCRHARRFEPDGGLASCPRPSLESPHPLPPPLPGCTDYVDPQALLEAQRWANFAVAA